MLKSLWGTTKESQPVVETRSAPKVPPNAARKKKVRRVSPSSSLNNKAGRVTPIMTKSTPPNNPREKVQVTQLSKVVRSTDPRVIKLIDVASNCRVIVSRDLTIYSVRPEKGSATAGQLSTLIDALGAIKGSPIARFDITPSVYETYQRGKLPKLSGKADVKRIEMVDRLIIGAIANKASDIHIQIYNDHADIRLRVNQLAQDHELGVNADVAREMVRSMWNNYKKDDSPDWKPHEVQDTSFIFRHPHKKDMEVTLRGNSIPEWGGGVKAVFRLRDSKERIALNDMGYEPQQVSDIRAMAEMKQGLFLTTGPTNSGKSTTTTTIMGNIPKHYITVEVADPVETRVPGVAHFQVANDDEKLEAVLKGLVRQDINFVFLGELRSKTTIDAAETMAFAGQAVVSTLHTSSISAAPHRLLALGLSQHTLGSNEFLTGVVAQNLIPVLCDNCKANRCIDRTIDTQEKTIITDSYRNLLQTDNVSFHNPEGCEKCNGSGVQSISLIAEAMMMGDAEKKAMSKGDFNQINDLQRERKLLTKHQHAALKVRRGLMDPRHCEGRINKLNEANVGEFIRRIL